MNILIFNVNWLGDVIFSTPVFKALKAAYPGSRVSCIAVPRVKDILESCPFVDEVIIYDEKGKHRSLLGKIRIVRQLRRKKFDVVFLLHRSWTRALLVYLAGIKDRVGYDAKNRGWMLTHRIALPEGIRHRSDFYLGVIESYGVKVTDRTCELAVDPQAQKELNQILLGKNISPEEKFIVVNVGGNWDLKRWPPKYFAELIKDIVKRLKMNVVIPGAARDVPLAREVALMSGVNPVVLAGETKLKQLIALMARASVVVSSDSGPLHMAACVGTPIVGIFGPTRPEITGPRGKGKVVISRQDVGCNQDACYNLVCEDNKCMKAVGVEAVFEAVKGIINVRSRK